mmetsp:Transcript_16025/g.17927  ORF Transcript_16025/g.17927 Transcript_16025/m.17927 type:complete len:149 (-) Transcript_16025:173-619(-)
MVYHFNLTSVFSTIALGVLAMHLEMDFHNDKEMTLRYYQTYAVDRGPLEPLEEVLVVLGFFAIVFDLARHRNIAFVLISIVMLINLGFVVNNYEDIHLLTPQRPTSIKLQLLERIRMNNVYLTVSFLGILLVSNIGSVPRSSTKPKLQ